MIGHDYSKLYPSRVFACLKHLCTSNQPQPLRGNVRGPRIDRNDRKGCPANFIHHRLTVRNCVIIYHLSKVLKMLRCIRQESAINCTAIPRRIFFYRIPLAKRMKNRIPQGKMIPQYRTLKSKLPNYRLEKSSIP